MTGAGAKWVLVGGVVVGQLDRRRALVFALEGQLGVPRPGGVLPQQRAANEIVAGREIEMREVACFRMTADIAA